MKRSEVAIMAPRASGGQRDRLPAYSPRQGKTLQPRSQRTALPSSAAPPQHARDSSRLHPGPAPVGGRSPAVGFSEKTATRGPVQWGHSASLPCRPNDMTCMQTHAYCGVLPNGRRGEPLCESLGSGARPAPQPAALTLSSGIKVTFLSLYVSISSP